jgi:hypothetical protein
MEHLGPPADQRGDGGLRDRVGGGSRLKIEARRVPGPGVEAPLEGAGGDRRDRRLARTPGPRARAMRRGGGERILRDGQVPHEGTEQRFVPRGVAPGCHEMRATGPRHRRREQAHRQEQGHSSRRRGGSEPGRTRSHHSLIVRGSPPSAPDEGYRPGRWADRIRSETRTSLVARYRVGKWPGLFSRRTPRDAGDFTARPMGGRLDRRRRPRTPPARARRRRSRRA